MLPHRGGSLAAWLGAPSGLSLPVVLVAARDHRLC
eukprot:SAG31_NODE_46231_length_255_cov_0.839744_1_plen_34_part_01